MIPTQENSRTKIVKYQVVWYAVALVLYGWFLGWIAYEIFALHKPISAVSMTNYVGAITAMALVWTGNIIFTVPAANVLSLDREKVFKEDSTEEKIVKEKVTKKAPKKQRRQTKVTMMPVMEFSPVVQPKSSETQPKTKTQTELKLKQEARIEFQDAPISLLKLNPGTTEVKCLHFIKNSLEIPSRCLMCKELVQYLSKPKK